MFTVTSKAMVDALIAACCGKIISNHGADCKCSLYAGIYNNMLIGHLQSSTMFALEQVLRSTSDMNECVCKSFLEMFADNKQIDRAMHPRRPRYARVRQADTRSESARQADDDRRWIVKTSYKLSSKSKRALSLLVYLVGMAVRPSVDDVDIQVQMNAFLVNHAESSKEKAYAYSLTVLTPATNPPQTPEGFLGIFAESMHECLSPSFLDHNKLCTLYCENIVVGKTAHNFETFNAMRMLQNKCGHRYRVAIEQLESINISDTAPTSIQEIVKRHNAFAMATKQIRDNHDQDIVQFRAEFRLARATIEKRWISSIIRHTKRLHQSRDDIANLASLAGQSYAFLRTLQFSAWQN